MNDFIHDNVTGQQLAWITNGVVFSIETKQQSMLVRDGELYSLEGEKLNLRLQSLGANVREKAPSAFLKLLGMRH